MLTIFPLSLMLFIGILGNELMLQVETSTNPPNLTDKTGFNPGNRTQTEALLSLPVIQNEVENWYKISEVPQFKKLLADIIKKEHEFNNTHYALYTAYSNQWRIPQDLFFELYKKINPAIKNIPGIKNYRTFRWLPVIPKTIEGILLDGLQDGLINDNEWKNKAYLLSTNLALFGNIVFTGECTFEYLLNSKSQTPLNDAMLIDLLKQFKLTENDITPFLPEIHELETYLQAEEIIKPGPGKTVTWSPQSLAQIFVPKKVMPSYAYLAWVQGVPFEPSLISWVKNFAQTSLSRTPAYIKTQEVMDVIRGQLKFEKESNPLYNTMKENIKNGKYTNWEAILEKYKNAPHIFPDAVNLQARFMATPNIQNNLIDGIQVFDYDFISPENMALYKSKLNTIVDEIFEVIQKKSLIQQARMNLDQPTARVSALKAGNIFA